MAAAADELLLLERVFLRIGSADTDEQLQNAVSKFLPPVLLKLSSQQEGVRKKVMELLVHINKRIKSRPLVQLPVEALLLQYQDPAASSFVTNFTIIYIKLGFPRLPTDKQAELVPSVLNALEAKPQSHQDSLLMLIMPLLGSVKVPTDPAKRASLFGLNEKPHVTKQLSSLMLDMLLLPYGATGGQSPQSPSPSGPVGSEPPGAAPGAGPAFPVPAGMSPYTYRRVTAESGAPLRPETLEQVKLGIVRFLAGGVLDDIDILLHLVVAAADTRFSVANLADLELKKVIGSLDWSSALLSTPLYRLFLGTQGNVKPENKKSPASTRIRLKLLHYLCKVTGSGFVIPACIQVVFDSLYGANTNTRLKSLALQFTTNIIQQADISSLEPVGRLLLCGLTKLTEEGEPVHQAQAYVILGLLGRRLPALFANDLGLLETLFKKLVSESADVRFQIREGMLNLVPAYRYGGPTGADIGSDKANLDDSKMMLLHSLLSQYMDVEEPMVRFVATRFMATVFPPDHVQSKYLLLLATGDSKDEVYTEALKALYGSSFKQDINYNTDAEKKDEEKRLQLPLFREMMNYVYNESNTRVQKSLKCYTQGNHVLPFTPAVYKEILVFLRLCLIKDLNVPHTRDVIKHPTEASPVIAAHLQALFDESDAVEKNPLLQYLVFTKNLLKASSSVEALCCLLEVVGCVPNIHKLLLDDLRGIRELLNSTKEEIREHASVLYGIIIAHSLAEEKFAETVKDLVAGTGGSKYLEQQHGCLLGVANGVERRITAKMINYENVLNWKVYKDSVTVINSFLSNQNALLVSAACISIGLLGRCAPLPLDGSAAATKQDSANGQSSKLDVVNQLLAIMNNVKLPSKVRERAARSLGLVCVGEIFPHTREVLEGLLKTAKETKDVEVHFTVGESLVMCVQSVWSPEARDAWRTPPEGHSPEHTMLDSPPDEHLSWLLDQLLTCVAVPHPNSRQASCIWLLTLLKNCSDREPVKTRLSNIQVAFMDLLSENNDIVVDVASKGLGLVFESSETDMGTALLEQLVDQLQSGRKSIPQVTSDTKLFEEGELGKSPTGGNLSTYKELCSLASDLNKPDLIYKFMHLANHNTIWNSKKGAAFGFLTIANKAGEQLKPHLPKIIPRLYRYQFDPTPNLQHSMQRIWHALVPETQKTIDEYHQEILADLIQNLTADQWRVRQSCCLALQDLFRSGGNRSTHDSVGAMHQLWTQLFRVMDDVHEGTRVQANNTAKILSKLCIRACDASYGKDGAKMVEAILPVLLQNGIVNTVAEVRAISLQTVSQLVGAAGPQLQPFLAQLVPALLQATGELESGKWSHLSTMFGAHAHTQEAIDSVRASAAKSHYTTETMARCLQYVTAPVLEDLIPRVLDLMRGSIGLGTRVACAHFITLLSAQLPAADIQPHAGRLLAALVQGLTDRNAAIRKHYASTIGHLVAAAKESSREKLFAKLRTWYFEREDDSIRSACAYAIQSIGNHNQEILKQHSDVVLPLVFFAMHAEKSPETQHTIEVWTDIWSENSPGTETGIRQNIEVICDTLKNGLESPSWNMKAQAANAVSTVATKLGSSLDAKHRNVLLHILISGLSGRTWNGKEKLLKALASICNSCKESLKNDPEIPLDTLVDVIMKECKKEDIVYKRQALEALGDVLSSLKIDKFEELYNIVQVILSKNTANIGKEDDDEDLTAEETSKKREDLIKLRETVYETLGKAWPTDCTTQEKYGELFVEHCVACLPTTTRSVQVSVVAALCLYVDKLAILTNDSVSTKYEEIFPKILENIYKALSYALSISKHTKLRKEALNVILSLGKSLKEKNRTTDFVNLRMKFAEILPNIENDNQPEIKSRVVDLKDLFKTNK